MDISDALTFCILYSAGHRRAAHPQHRCGSSCALDLLLSGGCPFGLPFFLKPAVLTDRLLRLPLHDFVSFPFLGIPRIAPGLCLRS